MGRLLVVVWVLGILGALVLRTTRGGLRLATLRNDVFVGIAVGTFVWLVALVRF